jgi:hypothetical protein
LLPLYLEPHPDKEFIVELHRTNERHLPTMGDTFPQMIYTAAADAVAAAYINRAIFPGLDQDPGLKPQDEPLIRLTTPKI